jgi:hypothetical protein
MELSSLACADDTSTAGARAGSLVQWFGNPRYNPQGLPGNQWRALRTARYTYAVAEGDWGMLFDNEADPFQLDNLFGNSDYRALRCRLHSLLCAELLRAAESVPGFVLHAGPT